MSITEFAAKLDATNLKLDAIREDIRTLCQEASRYGYAAVCVYPCHVRFCADLLKNSRVKVCTVVGFPHGCSAIESKLQEIVQAQQDGAQEVDIVMNHAALRAGDVETVTDETVRLCETARQADLINKVIVETCYLNAAQKLTALKICEQSRADFIKTSTGFGSGGATIEDIQFFAKHRTTTTDGSASSIKIKASGGIRTLDKALALIDAGADRLGVSAAGYLLGELQASSAGS